jgi:hypothetical protein
MSAPALWGALLVMASVAACAVSVLLTMLVTPAAAAVILALPLVSLLGAGLCLVALRSIGRSGGAEVGRPIALLGLFVGLGVGIIQGAAALSALGSAIAVRRTLAPVVDAFLDAQARGDRAAARAALGELVAAHLSDERMDAFAAALDAQTGAPARARFDLGVMLRAMERTRTAGATAKAGATIAENPKPLELAGPRGAVLAFVMPDDQTMRVRRRIAIGDILVLLPDGSALTLRAEGPAAALASRLGWRLADVATSPPPTPSRSPR